MHISLQTPTFRVLKATDFEAVAATLPGWSWDHIGTTPTLCKRFDTQDWPHTLWLVNAIAWVAQRLDHHPRLDVRFDACTVYLHTHECGGVTSRDIQTASAIDMQLSGRPL